MGGGTRRDWRIVWLHPRGLLVCPLLRWVGAGATLRRNFALVGGPIVKLAKRGRRGAGAFTSVWPNVIFHEMVLLATWCRFQTSHVRPCTWWHRGMAQGVAHRWVPVAKTRSICWVYIVLGTFAILPHLTVPTPRLGEFLKYSRW